MTVPGQMESLLYRVQAAARKPWLADSCLLAAYAFKVFTEGEACEPCNEILSSLSKQMTSTFYLSYFKVKMGELTYIYTHFDP